MIPRFARSPRLLSLSVMGIVALTWLLVTVEFSVSDSAVLLVPMTFALVGMTVLSLWLWRKVRKLRHRLRLEQEFTRTALDGLPLPVYYKDADGRYLGGNRALETLFGQRMEEIRGRTLSDFHADADEVSRLAERDQAFIRSGQKSERLEVSHDGAIGRRTLINYRARFRNPEDEREGIVGALLDVTELRQAEQIREAGETRLHKLADHVPGTMFQFQQWPDGACRFPFATKGFEQLFGFTAEAAALDGKPLFERVHPADKQRFIESIRISAENLSVWQSQHRYLHPSGQERWFSGQAAPERQDDGSVLWHGYISDVTESKNAETAAHRNAELLRAMFEHLPDHVYYKDLESRFLGGNKVWLRERANSIEDVIGKTDADFYPPKLARELLAGEQRIMKSGVAERRRERHVRTDGSVFYLESLKCPFFGPDGEVGGIVGISRDVTEQVELEEHLIRAKEAAEEASVAKSEFLAMMSHEIRTPMNGVIGATSILLNTELDEEQQEFVRTIQVSGENLLVIINDILDYSKIEADRIELDETPFDLRSCVEDAVDLFTSAAAEKGLELVHSVDPAAPARFIGDAIRLRQVLVNLLSNGIKFTSQGEVVLSVTSAPVDSEEAVWRLSFAVKDTGVGVPESKRHRLFKPFSQADASNTRRFGGTGLGLVISRRLVELMDGSIDFESIEGVGSTFRFELRLRAAAPEIRVGSPPTASLRGRRVLTVDDNQTNRRILTENLRFWGMEVTSCASGPEALEAAAHIGSVDVVIADFQMPGMDGVDFARRLRLLENFQATPIVLLSSVDSAPRDPAVTLRLSKPVKIQNLQRALERSIGGATATGERRLPRHASPPAPRQPGRVLVAEDNAINRRIAQMMLERLGYEPEMATDGIEAVEACADRSFDLVLMDIQMPRMDGLEATRRIRAGNPPEQQPYIIALTAGAMESDREAAARVGMNAFLPKPLKLENLQQAIERAFRSSEDDEVNRPAAGL